MNIGIKTIAMIGLATLLGWSAATYAKAEVVYPITTEDKCLATEPFEKSMADVASIGYVIVRDLQGEEVLKFRQALVELGLSSSLDNTSSINRLVFIKPGPTVDAERPSYSVLFDVNDCFLNVVEESEERFEQILLQAGI